MAVSMVGGTIRQKLIHRESFRASVLQLTLATTRCQNHCTGILCLDIAFVLIEGHLQIQRLAHPAQFVGEVNLAPEWG